MTLAARLTYPNHLSLTGQIVLVTGGAGFVGSQLVRSLLAQHARVVVYDNFRHGSRANLADVAADVEVVAGDVLDEWRLVETFQRCKPTYVIHLAADPYVPSSYEVPRRFIRNNIEGTLNVLMAVRRFGAVRMLHGSSTEVYSSIEGTALNEGQPFFPMNTYAVSKLAADRLCYTFFHEHGVPVLIARIFNCYGPRATEPYLIPEIIAQLDKGPTVELGNLEARRDFTYVEDTALGLLAALQSPIPDGDAVNIGSGQTHSVRELVAKLARIMGHSTHEIRSSAERLRRNDIDEFKCDASRIHATTGWRPTVEIDDGLRRTVEWYRAHGSRWSWEQWTEGARLFDGSA